MGRARFELLLLGPEPSVNEPKLAAESAQCAHALASLSRLGGCPSPRDFVAGAATSKIRS
jgi:hypothetical protein